MSGYRGGSPQMVEGDHEVDPSLSRRLAHLVGFAAFFACAAVLSWVVLARLDGSATTYLSDRPGLLWALSALLFCGLAAHLAGREYGRRAEAARTSTWRAARTSRSDSTAAPADCRKCPGLRAENEALKAELEVVKIEALKREPVAVETGSELTERQSERPEIVDVIEVFEIVDVLDVPGEHELRETT